MGTRIILCSALAALGVYIAGCTYTTADTEQLATEQPLVVEQPLLTTALPPATTTTLAEISVLGAGVRRDPGEQPSRSATEATRATDAPTAEPVPRPSRPTPSTAAAVVVTTTVAPAPTPPTTQRAPLEQTPPTRTSGAFCSTGTDLVVQGSAATGVEVAICSSPSGNLEYHGHDMTSGKGIRLAACQEAPHVYRAYNDDWYYRVVDGRDLASDSSVALYNDLGKERWAHILTATGSEQEVPSGLRPC